jgi:hypothetical protein
MNSSGSLRFLMLLTLAAPACGTDGETSETSAGSSTSTGGDTDDSSGTDPTGGDATTTDATTTATSTATTADPTTTDATGSTTADPTTGDGTTGDDTTTGGAIADCGFDPGLAFTRDALVYQLESEDGATCVWLERRDDSEPDVIYKAVPYTLLEWKSGHAGIVTQLTDPAALTWESTHHNWTDVATATDAAVRYRLEDWLTKNDAFVDQFGLYAYDANTDALLWGPITLLPYTP